MSLGVICRILKEKQQWEPTNSTSRLQKQGAKYIQGLRRDRRGSTCILVLTKPKGYAKIWAEEDDSMPQASSMWGGGSPPYRSSSLSFMRSKAVMSSPAYGRMPMRQGVTPLRRSSDHLQTLRERVGTHTASAAYNPSNEDPCASASERPGAEGRDCQARVVYPTL